MLGLAVPKSLVGTNVDRLGIVTVIHQLLLGRVSINNLVLPYRDHPTKLRPLRNGTPRESQESLVLTFFYSKRVRLQPHTFFLYRDSVFSRTLNAFSIFLIMTWITSKSSNSRISKEKSIPGPRRFSQYSSLPADII